MMTDNKILMFKLRSGRFVRGGHGKGREQFNTNENAIILDPFVGSGTTFESCLKHKRFCVGFELLPDYCEIAKQRIIAVEKERDLFTAQIMLNI